MARPTRVYIDTGALLHNLNRVKSYAPHSDIIAMVKANAYGNGLSVVAPVLAEHVAAFGVACLEEALAIRALGLSSECILFQGIFSAQELETILAKQFQLVLHQGEQLRWLLANPLSKKIKVWVKVDTGMHRLGFAPQAVHEVLTSLKNCPWVDEPIGLMTHLACADEPDNPANAEQLKEYRELKLPAVRLIKSIGNSAAIISLPQSHADVVRPGIMLYGVSPFADKTGKELGLKPVMHFMSAVSALNHYPKGAKIGYGGTWELSKPARIGIVAVGYGDGYPRHIAANTPVWIKGHKVPIVGRVSMDMLAVDLTLCPEVALGDPVELWGSHIAVEHVAMAAGTIAYELLCQFSPRVPR